MATKHANVPCANCSDTLRPIGEGSAFPTTPVHVTTGEYKCRAGRSAEVDTYGLKFTARTAWAFDEMPAANWDIESF